MQANHSRDLSLGRLFTPKRLRELLFVSLLGGVLGLVVWHFAPKRWQATMLIQVAQAGDGVPIVDPAMVAANMQFPSSVLQAIETAGLGSEEDERGRLVKDSLWATEVKGAPLIEVGVQGYSREEAMHTLGVVLSMVQKKHGELLTPSTTRRQTLLDGDKQTLAELGVQRTSIISHLQSGVARDGSAFAQSVILADLLHSIDGQTHDLTNQIALLSEQLSPQKTFNTRAVSPIFAPLRPSSWPARFYFVWGVIAGAALWTWLRLLRDAEFRFTVRKSVFGAAAHA